MAGTKTNNTNTAREIVRYFCPVELVLTMTLKNGGHLGLQVPTMEERDGSKLSARRRKLQAKYAWSLIDSYVTLIGTVFT